MRRIIHFQYSLSTIKVLFIIFGMMWYLITFFLYQYIQAYIDKAGYTEGVVTQIYKETVTDENGHMKTGYGSKIEYTVDHERYSHVSWKLYRPRYALDEHMGVYYTLSDPETIRLDTFAGMWGIIVVFGGFGTICTLIGMYLILFKPKLQTRTVPLE